MPVPHFQQTRDGTCLPACVRMIFAVYGDERGENALSKLLGTGEFGTPVRNITRIGQFGYQVAYGSLSVNELYEHVAAGRYVIAFVLAEFLSWAEFSGLHAVAIVERIDSNMLAIHDPADPTGPRHVELNELLLAWEEFDNIAAVVWR